MARNTNEGNHAPSPQVLQCKRRRVDLRLGWAFPYSVEEIIRTLTAGGSTLHLFGGRAIWGLRLDIDPIVKPDVVGDAWLPPFAKGSFDTVILDPPYHKINSRMRIALFYTASCLARARVVWFNTVWMIPGCNLDLEKSWLVIVGRSSLVRCLQVFRRVPGAVEWPKSFTGGPAIRYNRWMAGAQPLPFPK